MSKAGLGSIQRDVLWAMEGGGDHTGVSIAADTGQRRAHVYAALRSLEARGGLITESGRRPNPNRAGGPQYVQLWRLV